MLNLEYAFIGLLVFLLLATNVFWAKIVTNLVNKLMSRSYYEYQQAQTLAQPKVGTESVGAGTHTDPEDERQAKEMNSLGGFF